MAVKELVGVDPLGLAEIFLGRVGSSRGALEVDWTSGYYLSRDHRLLLILAEPKRPPQDVEFVEAMVARGGRGDRGARSPTGTRSPDRTRRRRPRWCSAAPT